MTTSVFTWEAADRAVRPAPSVRTRDIGFDSLRLVASLAIVWAHTPRSTALNTHMTLGSFGTSFFTAASIYFMAMGLHADPRRSYSTYAEQRIRRLMVPFLAWSVVYLLFRDACRWFITHEPLVILQPMMLLSGGQNHLWFLPFILLTTVAAFPLVRAGLASEPRRACIVICSAAIGLSLTVMPEPAFAPDVETINFYRCAWYVLPSAFLGLSIALWDELVQWLRARAPRTTGLAIVIAVVSASVGTVSDSLVCAKTIPGIAWLIAALSIPHGPWQRRIARYTPLAFGLYLVHPLVLGCLRAAEQFARLGQPPWLDGANFLLTVVLGLGMVRCLHRSRASRWLVP